jgi:DUF4097 and DUF4098 domain-containing protein YvlB
MTRHTLAAVLALAGTLHLPATGGAQSGRVDTRHSAAANATVEISVAGTIRVTGWNRNEVHVTGTTTRPGDRVVVGGSGRSVSVGGGRGATHANLEIRVPAGASVEVSASDGPVSVSGVGGAVEVSTRGGAVTVAGTPRRIEVSSMGGGVVVDARTGSLEISALGGPVRVSGSVVGRTEVNALGGPVELLGTVNDVQVNSLGGGVRIASASGRVEVTSVAGNVEVRGSRLRGSVSSVSGNLLVISTAPLAGALSLESHSGDVELRLPARAGATVNVTTYSGRFESDIAVETRRASARDRQVVVAGGGTAVSISTFSGRAKLGRS